MKFDQLTVEGWIGQQVFDSDGDKIGTVADVYLDDATGEPEWLAILTGLFGSRISFVPLLNAAEKGDTVLVAYSKSLVKDAPRIEVHGALSVEEEQTLYAHYGLPYEPKLRSSEDGVEALQGAGSTTISAEVSPDVALTRLRRRDDEAVQSLGFEDDDAPRG